MRIMWRIEDAARLAAGLKGPNDVVAAWDYLILSVPSKGPENASTAPEAAVAAGDADGVLEESI
jgi:hypothetical protein